MGISRVNVESEADDRYVRLDRKLAEWVAALAAADFALTWAGEQIKNLRPQDDEPWQLFSLATQAQRAHAEMNCLLMNCPENILVDTWSGNELAWNNAKEVDHA